MNLILRQDQAEIHYDLNKLQRFDYEAENIISYVEVPWFELILLILSFKIPSCSADHGKPPISSLKYRDIHIIMYVTRYMTHHLQTCLHLHAIGWNTQQILLGKERVGGRQMVMRTLGRRFRWHAVSCLRTRSSGSRRFCRNDEPQYWTMSRDKTKLLQCEKRQIVTGLLWRGLTLLRCLILLSLKFICPIYVTVSHVSWRHLGEKGRIKCAFCTFSPQKYIFLGYWFDGDKKYCVIVRGKGFMCIRDWFKAVCSFFLIWIFRNLKLLINTVHFAPRPRMLLT
jgi:hypothetical protein